MVPTFRNPLDNQPEQNAYDGPMTASQEVIEVNETEENMNNENCQNAYDGPMTASQEALESKNNENCQEEAL
jgi:hypothetical protein